MSRAALLVAALVVAPATAPRANAFDFGLGLFKKKPKVEPPTRVKQLIATLQSDQDEKARLTAAEELRSFDPRTNPEMLPALTGSLQRDPSAAVRSEAAETLGRLKPVDQATGLILETVQEADPAATVREAAKAALWQYHLNGYRSATTVADGRPQTAEPPLAARKQVAVAPKSFEVGFRPITNGVGKAATYQPTGEPPLAKSKSGAKPEPVTTPAPLPTVAAPTPPAAAFPMAMPAASQPAVPSLTPPPAFTLPPAATSFPPLPAGPGG